MTELRRADGDKLRDFCSNKSAMTNLEKLRGAFTKGLNKKDAEITESLMYGDGWDSVDHMLLVDAIERAFDIMLETDEVIAMSSFAAAKSIVAKHGIDFDAAG
jgi:acyl carrier protein